MARKRGTCKRRKILGNGPEEKRASAVSPQKGWLKRSCNHPWKWICDSFGWHEKQWVKILIGQLTTIGQLVKRGNCLISAFAYFQIDKLLKITLFLSLCLRLDKDVKCLAVLVVKALFLSSLPLSFKGFEGKCALTYCWQDPSHIGKVQRYISWGIESPFGDHYRNLSDDKNPLFEIFANLGEHEIE